MSQKIFDLIEQEKKRQLSGLEMIPSENYVSENVLKALGSILTDKYSEGYPGARYYGGNEFIDAIERYTQDLANELFKTEYAVVQPYSGSPANLAVDLALALPNDPILGMSLTAGGHLTHGASVSFTGKLFKAINYGVGEDGKIDFDEVERLALEYKPKIIWAGLTAYPYKLDWQKFSDIAQKIGAYLVADISHIAGLVVTNEHESPVPFVDVVTTTTHKTLRGPRGAIILVTKKGLEKDPLLPQKLEKTVFPGLQGGPHNHVTAAMAVAFEEAKTAEYKVYIKKVVRNANVLAEELGSYTENHLVLLDLSNYGFGLGYQAQIALEEAGITINKNLVPNGPRTLPTRSARGKNTVPVTAFYPNGIRLGTPALTSRGMKEEEMRKIASWIKQVLEEVKDNDLPETQEQRRDFIKEFRKKAKENQNLKRIKAEIEEFAKGYPVPGI